MCSRQNTLCFFSSLQHQFQQVLQEDTNHEIKLYLHLTLARQHEQKQHLPVIPLALSHQRLATGEEESDQTNPACDTATTIQ